MSASVTHRHRERGTFTPISSGRASSARFPREAGFTLIELLVVIAIIAILAAILFPVFAQARDKARQTTCLSNNKQMGLALMMYVQDYDETYPWAVGSNVAPSPGDANLDSWAGLIQPYVKNLAMFQCPSQPDVPIADWMGLPAEFKAAGPRNYAANSEVIPWQGFSPDDTEFGRKYNAQIRSMAAIPEPAGTIVFLETYRGGTVLIQKNRPFDWIGTQWWWSVLNDGTAWYADVCPKTGVAPADVSCADTEWDWKAQVRHQNGSNYTFGDGHAKYMMPGATLKARQKTSPTGNMWVWDKDTPDAYKMP